MDRRQLTLAVLRGAAVFGAALVVTWFALPSPIGSLAWIPSPAPALDGPYKMNDLLQKTERRYPELWGGEDIAFDDDGRAYTGLKDGRIMRLDGDGAKFVANTMGRPLGLEFSPADGLLYVCDADRGLLQVDPRDGKVTVLVDGAEGERFAFTNDLEITHDGTIYFTDASSVWGKDKFTEDLLDQRPTGRVMRYEPQTGAVTVLMRELSFANGLALMPDERSLIVAETGRYRLWRLSLDGERRNLAEVIKENLPGFPDNLSVSPRGTVWVAMASTRKRLLDMAHPYPVVKDAIASLPKALRPKAVRWGYVLEVDADGQPLRSLQDPSGDIVDAVTSAEERDGQLWLGTLTGNGIGVLILPPPEVVKAPVAAEAPTPSDDNDANSDDGAGANDEAVDAAPDVDAADVGP
jgi:sugar lactone lactonase YvrE